jgi:acyl-CoA reductase-like NAD-dependent aldehyde dehydrogenase
MKQLWNLIDGTWTAPSDGTYSDLVDPATEQVVARWPVSTTADVDRAVAAATMAQRAWSEVPVADRVRRLTAWADAVVEHAQELAELQCSEMGQPVALARTFVEMSAGVLRTAAMAATGYPFERVVAHDDGGVTRILRHPLGVAAVITPWNFPVATVLSVVGALLAAGNTLVMKPSERSPLSTARLLELAELPPGVVNLVLGDARAGAPLSAHPDVELVHFTGSVAAGREIGGQAGRLLHRSILELGGKDPVVVDAGVDPVATAEGVAFGAFMNSGQICTSMERIYVHHEVAPAFVAALVEAAEAQTLGDGRDASTVLGPLVDRRQRDLVHRHVTDARERGATVLTGGEIPPGPGFFYPATVVTDVDDSMLLLREETFGPVAPVQVVDSFEEGLRLASGSRFGLAATVYTPDPDHAAAAASIPAGLTWVNRWQGGGPEMMFEPAGDSGMGVAGGHAAYDAATRLASVYVAPFVASDAD